MVAVGKESMWQLSDLYVWTTEKWHDLPPLLRATLSPGSPALCHKKTQGIYGGVIYLSPHLRKGSLGLVYFYIHLKIIPFHQQGKKKWQLCPNLSWLGTTYCENCSPRGRKKAQIKKFSLLTFHSAFTWNDLCFAKPFPIYFLIFPKVAFDVSRVRTLEDSQCLPVGMWHTRTSVSQLPSEDSAHCTL